MKNILKKWSIGLMSTCAALLIFAGTVSAHVTITPEVSAPGAWETYTIKVPVEKNVATTKIALKVPTGVEIMSYQPVPEWKITLDKDASGKTKTITWETTGAGLSAGQFQQFYFVAKNPEKETQAAWNAFQYYKDGTIVEWTGDEGSDSPHSVTQITTETKNTNTGNDGHHHDTNDKAEKTVTSDTNAEKTDSRTTVMTLSIVALVLSIIALAVSIIKRK